ncbi:MAG: hypothetical protein WDA75_22835, partial [Candidatus Latescibacterota bacterium]
FQEDELLTADGICVPVTWARLSNALPLYDLPLEVCTPERPQQTAAVAKFQRVLDLSQLSFGGRGIVYGPGVQRYTDDRWAVALGWSGASAPVAGAKLKKPWTHGWVCSTCTGIVLGYWLNANEEYTWRTGRSQTFQLRYPCAGKLYKGSTHVGYQEYVCPVVGGGFVKLDGHRIYGSIDDLAHVNVLEFPSHIVLLVKVDPWFKVIDPRTGLAARAGVYRFGADGWRDKKGTVTYYAAKRTTWRRLSLDAQLGRGRIFGVAELRDDGTTPIVKGGRWHNNPTRPFVLAGLEHITDRVPTMADIKEAGICSNGDTSH